MNAIPQGTMERQTPAEIKRHIETAMREFVRRDNNAATMRDDAKKASDKVVGVREDQLTKLADLSRRHDWDGDDVKVAATEIAKAIGANENRAKSSLATFKSELVLVCHRKVRGIAADTFNLTRTAFDREDDEAKKVKDHPKILRKAFVRSYHAALEVFRAHVNGPKIAVPAGFNFSVASYDELTGFAEAMIATRTFDPKRVAARLKKIRDELEAFARELPVQLIEDCVDALKDISEAELKAAHKLAQSRKPVEAPETGDDDTDMPELDENVTVENVAAPEAAPMNEDEALAEAIGSFASAA